jgi:hypothetical protein
LSAGEIDQPVSQSCGQPGGGVEHEPQPGEEPSREGRVGLQSGTNCAYPAGTLKYTGRSAARNGHACRCAGLDALSRVCWAPEPSPLQYPCCVRLGTPALLKSRELLSATHIAGNSSMVVNYRKKLISISTWPDTR